MNKAIHIQRLRFFYIQKISRDLDTTGQAAFQTDAVVWFFTGGSLKSRTVEHAYKGAGKVGKLSLWAIQ